MSVNLSRSAAPAVSKLYRYTTILELIFLKGQTRVLPFFALGLAERSGCVSGQGEGSDV